MSTSTRRFGVLAAALRPQPSAAVLHTMIRVTKLEETLDFFEAMDIHVLGTTKDELLAQVAADKVRRHLPSCSLVWADAHTLA